MIRVLVVDDEVAVRDAVAAVLRSDPQMEVCFAPDGQAAVDHVGRHQVDVVLLDLRMPEVDGLSAARRLRNRDPRQRIIVLTTFGEAAYVQQAVDLGVDGFLLKAGNPYELLHGVRAVVAGGACLSPAIAAFVLADARVSRTPGQESEAARRALAALPRRERQVVELVGRGLPNADIARELHLGESTVKSYLTTAFARLGVVNRVQAALLAWHAR